MQKEQYHLEFVFEKVGKAILWDAISSAAGMAGWFAERATSAEGRFFTFTWSKTEAKAEVVNVNQGNSIRFHWTDDDNPETFFELRLVRNELTGDNLLEIIDFAEPDEKASDIIHWETQIKNLRRNLGLMQ
jgi:uncharacterized protein YndB with AHSA1/START domain